MVTAYIDKACEDQKDNVRAQVRWRYVEQLSGGKDRSTREREADHWFESEWAKPEWRRQVVGGKRTLKLIRKWAQDQFKVTLTTGALFSAMQSIPSSLKDSLLSVVKHLCVEEKRTVT